MVSSTPRPHFTPGKDPVPILQEAGWAPGPVWMGGKSRPHRDSIPDPPARSQSLNRLSYPAHTPSSAVVKERVELYLYFPFGPYGLYRASVPVQGCTLRFVLLFLSSVHRTLENAFKARLVFHF